MAVEQDESDMLKSDSHNARTQTKANYFHEAIVQAIQVV